MGKFGDFGKFLESKSNRKRKNLLSKKKWIQKWKTNLNLKKIYTLKKVIIRKFKFKHILFHVMLFVHTLFIKRYFSLTTKHAFRPVFEE